MFNTNCYGNESIPSYTQGVETPWPSHTTHSNQNIFHQHAVASNPNAFMGYGLGQVQSKELDLAGVVGMKETAGASSTPAATNAWHPNHHRMRYSSTAAASRGFLPYQMSSLPHYDSQPVDTSHITHTTHPQFWMTNPNAYSFMPNYNQRDHNTYAERTDTSRSTAAIRHNASVPNRNYSVAVEDQSRNVNATLQQQSSEVLSQHCQRTSRQPIHQLQQHQQMHHQQEYLRNQLTQREREPCQYTNSSYHQESMRVGVDTSLYHDQHVMPSTQHQHSQYQASQEAIRKAETERRAAYTTRQAWPQTWAKPAYVPFETSQAFLPNRRSSGSAFQPCSKQTGTDPYSMDSIWAKSAVPTPSSHVGHATNHTIPPTNNHIPLPAQSWLHDPTSHLKPNCYRPPQEINQVPNVPSNFSTNVLNLDTGQVELSMSVVPPDLSLYSQTQRHRTSTTLPASMPVQPRPLPTPVVPQNHLKPVVKEVPPKTVESARTTSTARAAGLDVRQFLATWDEDLDIATPRPAVVEMDEPEQPEQPATSLVVLDYQNVPSEEAAGLLQMYPGLQLSGNDSVVLLDNNTTKTNIDFVLSRAVPTTTSSETVCATPSDPLVSQSSSAINVQTSVPETAPAASSIPPASVRNSNNFETSPPNANKTANVGEDPVEQPLSHESTTPISVCGSDSEKQKTLSLRLFRKRKAVSAESDASSQCSEITDECPAKSMKSDNILSNWLDTIDGSIRTPVSGSSSMAQSPAEAMEASEEKSAEVSTMPESTAVSVITMNHHAKDGIGRSMPNIFDDGMCGTNLAPSKCVEMEHRDVSNDPGVSINAGEVTSSIGSQFYGDKNRVFQEKSGQQHTEEQDQSPSVNSNQEPRDSVKQKSPHMTEEKTPVAELESNEVIQSKESPGKEKCTNNLRSSDKTILERILADHKFTNTVNRLLDDKSKDELTSCERKEETFEKPCNSHKEPYSQLKPSKNWVPEATDNREREHFDSADKDVSKFSSSEQTLRAGTHREHSDQDHQGANVLVDQNTGNSPHRELVDTTTDLQRVSRTEEPCDIATDNPHDISILEPSEGTHLNPAMRMENPDVNCKRDENECNNLVPFDSQNQNLVNLSSRSEAVNRESADFTRRSSYDFSSPESIDARSGEASDPDRDRGVLGSRETRDSTIQELSDVSPHSRDVTNRAPSEFSSTESAILSCRGSNDFASREVIEPKSGDYVEVTSQEHADSSSQDPNNLRNRDLSDFVSQKPSNFMSRQASNFTSEEPTDVTILSPLNCGSPEPSNVTTCLDYDLSCEEPSHLKSPETSYFSSHDSRDSTGRRYSRDLKSRDTRDFTSRDPNDFTFQEPNDLTSREPKDMSQKPNDLSSQEPNDLTSYEPNDLTSRDPSEVTNWNPSDLTSREPSVRTSPERSDLTSQEPSDLTSQEPRDLTSCEPSDLMKWEPTNLASQGPGDLTTQERSDLSNREPRDLTSQKQDEVSSQQPSDLTSRGSNNLTRLEPSELTCLESNELTSRGPNDLPSQESSDLSNQESSDCMRQETGDSSGQAPSDLTSEVKSKSPIDFTERKLSEFTRYSPVNVGSQDAGHFLNWANTGSEDRDSVVPENQEPTESISMVPSFSGDGRINPSEKSDPSDCASGDSSDSASEDSSDSSSGEPDDLDNRELNDFGSNNRGFSSSIDSNSGNRLETDVEPPGNITDPEVRICSQRTDTELRDDPCSSASDAAFRGKRGGKEVVPTSVSISRRSDSERTTKYLSRIVGSSPGKIPKILLSRLKNVREKTQKNGVVRKLPSIRLTRVQTGSSQDENEPPEYVCKNRECLTTDPDFQEDLLESFNEEPREAEVQQTENPLDSKEETFNWQESRLDTARSLSPVSERSSDVNEVRETLEESSENLPSPRRKSPVFLEDTQEHNETQEDKEEIGKDKEEIGKDKEEIGKDKEEIGKDKEEIGKDKEEIGNDKQEIGNDKQEIGKDKQDVSLPNVDVISTPGFSPTIEDFTSADMQSSELSCLDWGINLAEECPVEDATPRPATPVSPFKRKMFSGKMFRNKSPDAADRPNQDFLRRMPVRRCYVPKRRFSLPSPKSFEENSTFESPQRTEGCVGEVPTTCFKFTLQPFRMRSVSADAVEEHNLDEIMNRTKEDYYHRKPNKAVPEVIQEDREKMSSSWEEDSCDMIVSNASEILAKSPEKVRKTDSNAESFKDVFKNLELGARKSDSDSSSVCSSRSSRRDSPAGFDSPLKRSSEERRSSSSDDSSDSSDKSSISSSKTSKRTTSSESDSSYSDDSSDESSDSEKSAKSARKEETIGKGKDVFSSSKTEEESDKSKSHTLPAIDRSVPQQDGIDNTLTSGNEVQEKADSLLEPVGTDVGGSPRDGQQIGDVHPDGKESLENTEFTPTDEISNNLALRGTLAEGYKPEVADSSLCEAIPENLNSCEQSATEKSSSVPETHEERTTVDYIAREDNTCPVVDTAISVRSGFSPELTEMPCHGKEPEDENPGRCRVQLEDEEAGQPPVTLGKTDSPEFISNIHAIDGTEVLMDEDTLLVFTDDADSVFVEGDGCVQVEVGNTEELHVEIQGENAGQSLVEFEDQNAGEFLVEIEDEDAGEVHVEVESENVGQSFVEIEDENAGQSPEKVEDQNAGEFSVEIENEDAGELHVEVESEDAGQSCIEVEENAGQSCVQVGDEDTGETCVERKDQNVGEFRVEVYGHMHGEDGNARKCHVEVEDARAKEFHIVVNEEQYKGLCDGTMEVFTSDEMKTFTVENVEEEVSQSGREVANRDRGDYYCDEIGSAPVEEVVNSETACDIGRKELDGAEDLNAVVVPLESVQAEQHEEELSAKEEKQLPCDKVPLELKCSLSWDRILNEGQGLVLGPANVEVRVPGEAVKENTHWKVVTRERKRPGTSKTSFEENNNVMPDVKSPIIVVKRLILKRPKTRRSLRKRGEPDALGDLWKDNVNTLPPLKTKAALKAFQAQTELTHLRNRNRSWPATSGSTTWKRRNLKRRRSDVSPSERKQRCLSPQRLPKVIIKKTGPQYQSFICEDDVFMQPVVSLERNTELDDLAVSLWSKMASPVSPGRESLQTEFESNQNHTQVGNAGQVNRRNRKQSKTGRAGRLMKVVELLQQWRQAEQEAVSKVSQDSMPSDCDDKSENNNSLLCIDNNADDERYLHRFNPSDTGSSSSREGSVTNDCSYNRNAVDEDINQDSSLRRNSYFEEVSEDNVLKDKLDDPCRDELVEVEQEDVLVHNIGLRDESRDGSDHCGAQEDYMVETTEKDDEATVEDNFDEEDDVVEENIIDNNVEDYDVDYILEDVREDNIVEDDLTRGSIMEGFVQEENVMQPALQVRRMPDSIAQGDESSGDDFINENIIEEVVDDDSDTQEVYENQSVPQEVVEGGVQGSAAQEDMLRNGLVEKIVEDIVQEYDNIGMVGTSTVQEADSVLQGSTVREADSAFEAAGVQETSALQEEVVVREADSALQEDVYRHDIQQDVEVSCTEKDIPEENAMSPEQSRRTSIEEELALPIICQVCGFTTTRLDEQASHIRTHSYHCQRCQLAFLSHEDFKDHMVAEHPTIEELHHCLLCQRSFPTAERHAQHKKGWHHCQMERSQRHTIHSLYRYFTGNDCPYLPSLVSEEEKAFDWLPSDPGVIHFYHDATPLQLAFQDCGGAKDDTGTC